RLRLTRLRSDRQRREPLVLRHVSALRLRAGGRAGRSRRGLNPYAILTWFGYQCGVRRIRLISAVAVAVLAVSGAAVGRAEAATPSVTKGVVLVTTNLAYQGARAAGTGIVLTGSGEVLTNNHVIRGATTINVTVPQTKHKYTAQVVGYDIADDIALLKLDGAS